MTETLTLLRYFKRGIFLVHSSLHLFIGYTCISLASSLLGELGTTGLLFSTFFIVFLFGFSLSYPQLLLHSVQERRINYPYILSTWISNTKRMLGPFLAIWFLGMLLLILIFGVLVLLFGMIGGSGSFMGIYQGALNSPFNPISFSLLFLLSLSYAVLIFTSIYFSIERKGLFTAMKDSFRAALKHRRFIVVVTLLFFLLNLLFAASLPFILYGSFFFSALSTILYSYIIFIMDATALNYYQKNLVTKK